MKLFLTIDRDKILVMARAEGPKGILGDFQRTIGRGGVLFGRLGFATLLAAGNGGHEYDDLLKLQARLAKQHESEKEVTP